MTDKFSVTLDTPGGVVAAPKRSSNVNPLGPILNAVSGGLQSFDQARQESKRRKAAAAKAEKETRANDAAGYTIDSILKTSKQFREEGRGLFDVYRPEQGDRSPDTAETPPTQEEEGIGPVESWTPEDFLGAAVENGAVAQDKLETVEEYVSERSDEASNAREGVKQGTFGRLSASAAIEEIIQDVRTRFPDVHPDVIAGVLSKFNVDDIPFMELQEANKQARGVLGAEREYTEEMYQAGLALVGPEAASIMSREDIVRQGAADKQTMEALERQTAQATLNSKLIDNKQTLNKLEEEANAKKLEQAVFQGVEAGLNPLIEAFNKVLISAGDAGANPAIEQELERTRQLIRQTAPILIERYIGQLGISDTAKAAEVRKFFMDKVENTIFAPLEARDEGLGQLAKKMQDRLGITATMTYPFISMLKEMGVSVSVADALMGSMPEEITGTLGREIAGLARNDVNSLLRGNPASIHLTKIVELLKGDISLQDVADTPAESRAFFKTIKGVNATTGKAIASGDLTDAEAYANTQAEIVIAAGSLNQASGISPLTNALESLTGGPKGSSKPALQALRDIDDADGVIASRGTRAAVGQTIAALQNSPSLKQGPFSVKWDNQEGEYKVYSTWKPGKFTGNFGGFAGLGKPSIETRKPATPESLIKAKVALNKGIDFLVETREWDDKAPKGSNMELRRFYGRGESTAAMRKEAESRRKASEQTPNTDALKGLQELNKSLESGDFSIPTPERTGVGGVGIDAKGNAVTQGNKGNKVTIVSADNWRTKVGKNEKYMTMMEEAAEAEGIPANIALTLWGHESGGFNPNAKANAGKGRTAYGLGQIVDKFWDGEAQETYGKRVKDLTPEENSRLAAKILNAGFKKYGNWKDALSFYHSGRPYTGAKGAKDANISTQNYVNGILTAAGIEE